MSKYKCNVCQAIYSEEEAEVRDTSFSVPYGEGNVLKSESERVCPYCKESTDNAEEGEICSVCGEFTEDAEEMGNGEYICENCIASVQRRLTEVIENEFTDLEAEVLKDCGILNFGGVA